jgi:hypothetical protein
MLDCQEYHAMLRCWTARSTTSMLPFFLDLHLGVNFLKCAVCKCVCEYNFFLLVLVEFDVEVQL